jgi:hypothetical protein
MFNDREDDFWDNLIASGLLTDESILRFHQRMRQVVSGVFDELGLDDPGTAALTEERFRADPLIHEMAEKMFARKAAILELCTRKDGRYAVPPCEWCSKVVPIGANEMLLADYRAEVAARAGFRYGRICDACRPIADAATARLEA